MWRASQYLAAFLVMGTALIGLLHMPFARGLMQRVGGCPFPTSDRTLTAAEAEALRVETFAPAHSRSVAPRRPALGFALERTSRREVAAWASAHHVTCQSDRHGAGLTCPNVATSALPEPALQDLKGTLMFGFDARERLVSVHYLTRGTAPAAILARAADVDIQLGTLSDEVKREGHFAFARPLSQARTQVAFRDYLADVSVTNLGDGATISERYQAFAH